MKGAWEGGSKPCTQQEHEAWLADIRHWRDERRIRIGYDGSRYDMPELKWTQSSFFQPQMMVQDRYFYDPVAGKYTVDRYLDDLEKRYGGIDAVLIWPTYPNMGIDNRNQHDLIRCMPGGVAGVRQMIADFHRRGVRVLFPMMMWDQGTRDPGMPWPQAIAELMKEVGADGINGDTQDGVPLAFSLAADKVGHPLAFEPEGGPSDEALAWNRDDLGAISVSVRAHGRQVQMAGDAAHGEHFRPLEARQDRQPAVRLLQRRRLGKLGKHLGNLEWDHAARRGSHAPCGNHGARGGSVSHQQRLGTAVADVALWRLCQPVADWTADRLDHREPQ